MSRLHRQNSRSNRANFGINKRVQHTQNRGMSCVIHSKCHCMTRSQYLARYPPKPGQYVCWWTRLQAGHQCTGLHYSPHGVCSRCRRLDPLARVYADMMYLLSEPTTLSNGGGVPGLLPTALCATTTSTKTTVITPPSRSRVSTISTVE